MGFVTFLDHCSPVVQDGRATSNSVGDFAVFQRPLSRFLRTLGNRFQGFAVELQASIRRRVYVFANDFRRVIGRDFDQFVVLVYGLMSPRAVRDLAYFGERVTSTLSQGSYDVLPQRVALRSLGVFSNGEYLVIIIACRTDQLRAVGGYVLLKGFPVRVKVSILVPPAIGPSDTSQAVVDRRLYRLVVRGLVVTLPVSFQVKASNSASNSSLEDVFAVPICV